MKMKTIMVTVFAFCMSACPHDPTDDQPKQQAPDSQTEQQAPDDPAAISTDKPTKDAGPVFPNLAACGTSGPNLQHQVIADASFPNTANQRWSAGEPGGRRARRARGGGGASGSSTGCTDPGALQPTDDAEYFCWTNGTGGSWTYLRNVRTGVRGWVRDDLLRDAGASTAFWCGF
jgi:hypothetical protein